MININRIQSYKKHALIEEITPLQIKLSEEFIYPNLNQLNNYCNLFREKIDYEIKNKIVSDLTKPFKNLDKQILNEYPIGKCGEITISFLYYLKQNKLSFLTEFEQNGGVIKQVWGNIRNEFFQNATQIGEYLVDVADDTVYVNKPKVNICKLKNIQFSNIQSIEEFIDIKMKYHHVEIYKNNVIPEIYMEFPLIQVSNKRVSFIDNKCLEYLMKEKNQKIPNNIVNVPEEYLEKILLFFNKIKYKSYLNNTKKAKIYHIIAFFNHSN